MANLKLLLLGFIFPVCLHGQVFNFKNFFIDDGLSQSQVTDIDHDSYGNIWLGTYGGGVNQFDGHHFKIYGIGQGLPHNQVNDIHVDTRNRVWCAMQSGGVAMIFDNAVNVYRFEGDESDAANSLAAWKNGIIVGTAKGRLVMIDGGGQVVVDDIFMGRGIDCVVSSDSLVFVAVKDSGVYSFNGDTIQNIAKLSRVHAITMVEQTLYIGSGNTLYVYGLVEQTFQKIVEFLSPVRHIEFDLKTKTVYVATYGNGVGRYVGGQVSYITESNGLASNYATAIHSDSYGLLWIGTDGAGLSQFTGFRFVHYTFNDQYDGNPVMGIYKADKDEMWFATYGHGIVKKVGAGFSHLSKSVDFPSNTYYAVEQHGENTLWFTTKDDGLVAYNTQSENIQHFNASNSPLSNNLLFLKEDARGDLYVTSKDRGLFIRHNGHWLELGKRHGLPDNYINFIMFDNENNLWLATASEGVVKISESSLQRFIQNPVHLESVETYKLKKNIYQVITLAIDDNGEVWAGLFGGGIAMVKNRVLVQMPVNKKIPTLNIYSMLYETDHSALWAGTDKGLVRLTLDKRSSVSDVAFFSSEHGFRGVECNRNALFYDYSSKSLWVGVVIGVTRFFPDIKALSSIAPDITIEYMTYRGRITAHKTYKVYDEIEWEKVPQIPYDSNGVRIAFKAVDQLQPEAVQYQYVMMGINENWHPLSSIKYAEYNYLPSGRYVFKLRAKNGQGRWSDYALHVPFVVETPYWQTKMFYGAVLIMFFILFGIVMYVRQRSLKERNRKLTEAVYERTEALNNEKIVVEQHREELRAQTEYLEQANRELEKLSLVASKTDNAVLISDKNGIWEWANEGFTKMYGYSLEQFIEMRGTTITETSSSPKIKHIIEEAVYLRKSVTYTSRILHNDDSELWVQSTLTPIFDQNDQLKRFIVIDADITHIKRINNELRKLSLVASKTDNSVIMMNKNGKIDWVNDAFHRFYDMSLEEFKTLYQKTIFDLHTGVKGLFDLNEIITSRKSKSFISKFVTQKGVQKWIQSNLTPVAGMGNDNDQLIAIETDITRLKMVEEEMKAQRKKSDELLLNILPAETAEELKTQGYAQPRYYESATVLFCDFKNFTFYCKQLTPHQLVSELREYFDRFDDIVGKYFVEKIKTIGDAYMCAGGLPIRNRSHAFDVLLTALEIQKVMQEINQLKISEGRQPWEMRMGIHSGDLVAGVVGKRKFAYDIWGDTVTIASRMESACEVGRINLSGDTYNMVKDFFNCTYRGKVEAKNIGKIDMYFLDGLKPEYAADDKGLVPNIEFKNYLAGL